MITIIGAGPVGSYTAYLLSKANKDVQLFEEHPKIGIPVQCTGIVTSSIKNFIKLDKDYIINTIDKVEIIAPNKSSAKLTLKNKEFILDRKKFDEALCNKALDAGAKLYLSHKFIEQTKDSILIKDTKNKKIKKIKKGILIGADGPQSQVAKSLGLFQNRRFLIGMQVRIKIKNDPSTYKTFFGKHFPKFFGWFVPESESIARVGLAAETRTRVYFDYFIKRFKGKILEKQAGSMPVYTKYIKISRGNTYLIGDAACQLKNTTGGGLAPGLSCARLLADAIINNKDYSKLYTKGIEKELRLHALIRNNLNKFSDKDYNYLVKLLNNRKTRGIIENHNREYPSKFILKLLAKEPRFLYFLKNALC